MCAFDLACGSLRSQPALEGCSWDCAQKWFEPKGIIINNSYDFEKQMILGTPAPSVRNILPRDAKSATRYVSTPIVEHFFDSGVMVDGPRLRVKADYYRKER